MKYYILDGYNILLRTHFQNSLSFENFRNQWIEATNHALADRKLRIRVVFDAANTTESRLLSHFKQLELVYSDPNQTADAYILDFLNSVKNKKSWTLVTDDRSLGMQARHLGAHWEGVRFFNSWFYKKNLEIEDSSGFRPSLSKPFFEYYVSMFEKNLQKTHETENYFEKKKRLKRKPFFPKED